MILYRKPKIPPDFEPYYKFLLGAIKQAKWDIQFAKVGRKHFESAVSWLLYGEGYDFCQSFLAEPQNVRKVFEPVVDARRDLAESR